MSARATKHLLKLIHVHSLVLSVYNYQILLEDQEHNQNPITPPRPPLYLLYCKQRTPECSLFSIKALAEASEVLAQEVIAVA